jgi:hypothetical protein
MYRRKQSVLSLLNIISSQFSKPLIFNNSVALMTLNTTTMMISWLNILIFMKIKKMLLLKPMSSKLQ